MTDLVFMLIVWSVLLWGLLRAWRRGVLKESAARLMWGVFVAVGTAFIFRAQGVEIWLADRFEGLPLALWIKMIAVVLAAYLYLQVLHRTRPDMTQARRWLIPLSSVTLLVNTLALYLGVQYKLTSHQVFHVITIVSDGLICLYMLTVFVPINRHLFYDEQLFPLRVKLLATLVFCAAYVPATAVSVIFGPYALWTGYESPLLEIIPIGMIVLVCLMIQLLPYRYLAYLELLYFYPRLVRLEQRVFALAGRRGWRWHLFNPFSPQSVQRVTYKSLINILDYSHEAAEQGEQGQRLHQEIMTAHQQESDFLELVRALGRKPL